MAPTPTPLAPNFNPQTDPLWYKDAIIYQLHIKAFFDSNNDGIGDFEGLTSKLDYVQELGVNTLWLLPFYPSPLRDDGYDIANYRDIHPSYGTMADFKRFIHEAHARGLRVITELVINHTSDEHPWFQAARHAPQGSPEREFYVWSDDNTLYSGTRIIFNDTEPSNWSWDPVAKQYYWHRFFSHQPDLNFDNPQVLQEVIDVMYYWLDMGVDGLRLDAVPYLVERDGTSNENLPETHDVIKKIRKALDDRYPDRLLLGEANMWPEDVLDYFGDKDANGNGDECHMAFHFPLMPRMYMALAQEDRHPITDIMRQTPDIPANCQWVTFLRNHDELTLEMVTDRERDYMWNFYAEDRRARINFGIRRRLAPLMQNDRRKVELLDSLLMSMPGTPVIYYGDEIGMGDNIFLGDRNGVRTPMQWSPDRNGGFSKADPNYLFFPAIMDPIYGFQAVNVEAQRRVQNSLFNWTRRLVTTVKQHKSFGRGGLRFLHLNNRKMLAYLRQYENETILCVANLSPSPQPGELDLHEFNGWTPVELLGQSEFPAIGDLPYFITLPGYGFYWFQLKAPGENLQDKAPPAIPEFYTLVVPQGFGSLMEERSRHVLEHEVLPDYLMTQRWYKSKSGQKPQVQLVDIIQTIPGYGLLLISAQAESEEARLYTLALGIRWETMEEDPFATHLSVALAKVRQGPQVGLLFEASAEDNFIKSILAIGRDDASVPGITVTSSVALPRDEELSVTPVGVTQSNTSILLGSDLLLKLLRQPEEGSNLEIEMGEYLKQQGYTHAPEMFGTVAWQREGHQPLAVMLLQQRIPNQGDGWSVTQDYLAQRLAEKTTGQSPRRKQPKPDDYPHLAGRLGLRTAGLHSALARATEGPFTPEPISGSDRENWLNQLRDTAHHAFCLLHEKRGTLPAVLQDETDQLLSYEHRFEEIARHLLPENLTGSKTRIHGDYHLGQVLVHQQDFYLIDFEGEPGRSLEERRAKTSPLKDVAGMVRSFDYAMESALPAGVQGEPREMLEQWRDEAVAAFLDGYRHHAPQGAIGDEGEMHRLLAYFCLDKAFYEIIYEAQNRPAWLGIPLRGLLKILKQQESQ